MSAKGKSQDEVVSSEENPKTNSFYDEENSVKLDGSAQDLLQFREYCELLRETIRTTWQRKKSQEKVLKWKESELSVSIDGDSELARAVNQSLEQSDLQSSPQEAEDSDMEDREGNKKRVSTTFYLL
ncbi:unnamed protein product [Trichobilharzia regenti]|nr:unnamed protein product [Trichobilharzia regenti]